ncbi:Ribonuclease II and R domain protein, partial [mine drainage metagenome]
NLRLHELEARWDEETLEGQEIPHLADLRILRALAEHLAEARGVRERSTPQYHDYTFVVEGEHVDIRPRPRGAPLDELVAELMIEVNRHWAGQLVEAGWLGLFRVQGQGRTGMSVDPAPHLGLGLNHYAWCSSPLRRYPDLVNQWQLIRLFQLQDPAVTDRVRLREESL